MQRLLKTYLLITTRVQIIIALSVIACSTTVQAQQWHVDAPNQTLRFELSNNKNVGLSYRVLRASEQREIQSVVNWSRLGFDLSWVREDKEGETITVKLGQGLRFIARLDRDIDDRYQMHVGKRQQNHYQAKESQFTFEHIGTGKQIRVDVQMANDGIAFRYVLPQQNQTIHGISDEVTEFNLGEGGLHWGQAYDKASKWQPAYETPYQNAIELGTNADPELGTGWGFPSLFQDEHELWLLLHESNLSANFYGSHLRARAEGGNYVIAPPLKESAQGIGSTAASLSLPAKLPWRFLLISKNLANIVESNRVFDLAEPSVIEDSSWVKPGIASWSWWSDHKSSKNARKLKRHISLASKMGWPYSLIDANWNQISKTAMRDLIAFASKKNVGLGFWYNSGGPSNTVTEEPRDRMHEATRRRAEMAKLQALGARYIKVDFFQSDKQFMIQRYLDILQDAADHELMVVFHGSAIPRGWARTYPNLMSMEAVRGAEFYTFDSEPDYAELAVAQNTVLPFTRNVIGSMDYTPVSFSEQKVPSHTSFAHEAALGVIVESGIQHLSDSVKSYRRVSKTYRDFLMTLPAVWDETKYLSGYPGKEVVLARRSGNRWYIAGLNGERRIKTLSFSLDFLPAIHRDNLLTTATLISDGDIAKRFTSVEIDLGVADRLTVKTSPAGGFVMIIDLDKNT